MIFFCLTILYPRSSPPFFLIVDVGLSTFPFAHWSSSPIIFCRKRFRAFVMVYGLAQCTAAASIGGPVADLLSYILKSSWRDVALFIMRDQIWQPNTRLPGASSHSSLPGATSLDFPMGVQNEQPNTRLFGKIRGQNQPVATSLIFACGIKIDNLCSTKWSGIFKTMLKCNVHTMGTDMYYCR